MVKNFSFFVLCIMIVCETFAKDVPVMYGGDENLDACSLVAQVVNLSSGPDGFLAVKAGPDLKAKRTDKLLNGQSLWICEEKENWFGIVYTKNAKLDCNVTSVVKKKKAYSGPCKSGWVVKKYVEPVAG